jgi:hypothetical protein
MRTRPDGDEGSDEEKTGDGLGLRPEDAVSEPAVMGAL